MEITYNYLKHTSKHPVRKFMIDNFYKTTINMVNSLDVETVIDVGCGEGFTIQRLINAGIGKIPADRKSLLQTRSK